MPEPVGPPGQTGPEVGRPAEPAADQPAKREELAQTGGGCLLRVFWMLLGNIILAMTAYNIAILHDSGFAVTASIVIWVTVAAMLGARYLDIKRFRGQTASGEPATMTNWRRYAIALVGIWLVVWIVALVIGTV